MKPFTFQTTANVLFEAGAAKKIVGLVSEFGARRVLFVTDKGVRSAGLTQDAEASFASGCELTVFEDVVADPPSHVVEAAVALCREKQVDAVVVVSAAVTNTSRPKTEALTYLEASKLPYLGAVIHQKSVIPETLISGQTVFEISGLTDAEQKSVDEFRAVYEWVRDKIALTHRVAA